VAVFSREAKGELGGVCALGLTVESANKNQNNQGEKYETQIV
jgi:hypothetical protein